MSNQLDDFFKNKLQESTFEYDESAWENARVLIENDERSKKRRYLFFMFAGLSILMLVGLSSYYIGRHTASPTDTPAYDNTPMQTNTFDETKIIANSDYKNSKVSSDDAALAVIEPLVTNNDLTNTTTLGAVVGEARQVHITPGNDKKNYTTTKTENNKKNSFNLSNAQGVVSTTTTIYNSTTVVTNPKIVNKATPKLSENQNATSTKYKQNDLRQLPLLNLQYFSDSNEKNVALSVEMPALQKNVEGSPIVDSSQKFYFGIRSGMALVPLKFMDFEAGVELGYQINRIWSISFQPKYQYQSLAQNTVDKSEIEQFGFGLRSSAYNLEAETVRSIHVPLMLSYAFGSQSIDLTDKLSSRYLKNKISFGVAYVVIDGITGTIFQSEAAGESSTYQSGWLAEHTFNRHNAEVMIGYDRYLSQRFSVGVQARYRVRDQFTEAFNRQNQDILAPSAFYLGVQANFKLF